MHRNAHLALHKPRRTLGMEGNGIEWGADLSGGIAGAAQAMLEEILREFAAVAGPVGPADPRAGERRRTASIA